MVINVTIQFPDIHNGKPLVRKDVEQWALSSMKATEQFTGIKLKLIEITEVTND